MEVSLFIGGLTMMWIQNNSPFAGAHDKVPPRLRPSHYVLLSVALVMGLLFLSTIWILAAIGGRIFE